MKTPTDRFFDLVDATLQLLSVRRDFKDRASPRHVALNQCGKINVSGLN